MNNENEKKTRCFCKVHFFIGREKLEFIKWWMHKDTEKNRKKSWISLFALHFIKQDTSFLMKVQPTKTVREYKFKKDFFNEMKTNCRERCARLRLTLNGLFSLFNLRDKTASETLNGVNLTWSIVVSQKSECT